jgi:hypothetical protein
MESNNSNSNMMDSDEEEVVVPDKQGAKIWPRMKFLCTKNQDIVFKILNAVDECKCTKELNANNTDYPKGNNWNRLFDHCFGGGSQGRGLLAGHLPKLATASKMKMKIMEIWAHLKKESTQDFVKVDMNLVQMALRQEMEYEQAKAVEKAAADKTKMAHEVLVEQMQAYEMDRGGLPPGAKGTVGAGRRQHSTNLKTNQPAAYSYVNLTTTGADNKGAIVIDDKTPPPKAKAKVKASTVHGGSSEHLLSLGQVMAKSFDKILGVSDDNDKVSVGGKRKRTLYEKQAALEKSILFYQKFPDNAKTQEAMQTAMDKHLKLTEEIQDCLDSDGE